MTDHSQIEIAAELAVPAVAHVAIGGWRAHLSSGHIRRINAVNLHGDRPAEHIIHERLSLAQELYRSHGLRPRLRTTSMDAWIDPFVHRWSEAGEALVMTIEPKPAEVGTSVSIDAWLAWLAPRAVSSGRFDEAAASARRLDADNIVVTVNTGGRIIGAARAVSAGGLTGLFDIMVDPEHRRQGHARSMINRLRGWASEGNHEVYLQVAAVNRPAITLYESMGFVERYRYRYRSPD
ncbi:MAG TPA: GNAT family N-acetyltransferase [Acidimicrobiia bacterium]